MRRAGKRGQVWIPDADAAGVTRSDVAQLNSPTASNFTLKSYVVLLSVRRVGIEWRTGKRCEIDGAVCRGATVVQTPLTGCINEDRSDVSKVRVGCRKPGSGIPETGKERRRRNERRGDDRWRWDARKRILQLERRRSSGRGQRLHRERSCQRVLQNVLIRQTLVVNTITAAQYRLLVARYVPGKADTRSPVIAVKAMRQRTV